jgi:hypothetical protein
VGGELQLKKPLSNERRPRDPGQEQQALHEISRRLLRSVGIKIAVTAVLADAATKP